MKITDKQLFLLQGYIKKKKPYFDTESRFELIDHLVCDFEENGNGNISEYLANKSTFIFNYKDSKSDEVHWAYQRELWKTFFSFFKNVKTFPSILILLVFLYQLLENFSQKTVGIIFFALILIPSILGFVKTYHKKREIRNLVEFKYLANVMSLPSLFLYLLGPFKEFWFSSQWLILTYLSVGVILNIAALTLILKKRKRILNKYSYLL